MIKLFGNRRKIRGWKTAGFIGVSLAFAMLFSSVLRAGEYKKPIIKLQTIARDYSIKAEMIVPYPPEVIYRIFTDYDSIDEHISLFKVSRVLERKGSVVYVYQVHVTKILFFKYETESTLEVHETPFRGFKFKEIKGDFKIHQGSWTLVPQKSGQSTLIKYESQAVPYSYVPRWMVAYFMKRNVKKAFEELFEWFLDESKEVETLHMVLAK